MLVVGLSVAGASILTSLLMGKGMAETLIFAFASVVGALGGMIVGTLILA